MLLTAINCCVSGVIWKPEENVLEDPEVVENMVASSLLKIKIKISRPLIWIEGLRTQQEL